MWYLLEPAKHLINDHCLLIFGNFLIDKTKIVNKEGSVILQTSLIDNYLEFVTGQIFILDFSSTQ